MGVNRPAPGRNKRKRIYFGLAVAMAVRAAWRLAGMGLLLAAGAPPLAETARAAVQALQGCPAVLAGPEQS